MANNDNSDEHTQTQLLNPDTKLKEYFIRQYFQHIENIDVEHDKQSGKVITKVKIQDKPLVESFMEEKYFLLQLLGTEHIDAEPDILSGNVILKLKVKNQEKPLKLSIKQDRYDKLLKLSQGGNKKQIKYTKHNTKHPSGRCLYTKPNSQKLYVLYKKEYITIKQFEKLTNKH